MTIIMTLHIYIYLRSIIINATKHHILLLVSNEKILLYNFHNKNTNQIYGILIVDSIVDKIRILFKQLYHYICFWLQSWLNNGILIWQCCSVKRDILVKLGAMLNWPLKENLTRCTSIITYHIYFMLQRTWYTLYCIVKAVTALHWNIRISV